MAITTKEQAFQVLETQKNGIPFEAIDFLYNSPTDEDILNKIRSTLEQIYDNIDQLEEGFYSEQTPKVNNTPKIGRNAPCPCSSGKKYKKCCLKNK
ncbi:SEC-C metal-binding domain-containing protein [Aureispira sp. CCB-E]|uniref:SEC-C metal-binding domain-containing protein n=1 Tax=Aureispira sp. CCB-E TaxID=3051121 RepID=UPI00286882CF|nr:SEC-C metal-binding domain-containing protein [Aureispira sp. CCB-E]WMX16952.1 SEC-C metal-binding domain-containing protein [Aureispira sp. CCB-E]